jgi:hypothetical protein
MPKVIRELKSVSSIYECEILGFEGWKRTFYLAEKDLLDMTSVS